MKVVTSHFPPARNALALAASLYLAGGLACEAGLIFSEIAER